MQNPTRDNSPIRCYINARFLTQTTTGVQRTAIEIVKALDNLLSQNDTLEKRYAFRLIAPRNVKIELPLKNIPLKCVGRLHGHLWEQLELPWHTRDGFLVSLGNVAPLVKRNQIVMIYDASIYAAAETYSWLFRSWYKVQYPWLGKIARKIITISDFSKKELNSFAGISLNKLEKVYLGCEHVLGDDLSVSRSEIVDLLNKPYLLAVSSLSPNKNFKRMMQAIESIRDRDFDFVIAGGTNPRIFQNQDMELPETIKYLGYVTDRELRWLYRHALAFVYPSLYEGFGLPPVEAMALGCPVIVSDIAPLKEVCGEAALYCDPYDLTDIAEKMKRIISDEALRQELKERGLKRVRQFSWSRAAGQLIELLDEILYNKVRK